MLSKPWVLERDGEDESLSLPRRQLRVALGGAVQLSVSSQVLPLVFGGRVVLVAVPSRQSHAPCLRLCLALAVLGLEVSRREAPPKPGLAV